MISENAPDGATGDMIKAFLSEISIRDNMLAYGAVIISSIEIVLVR